MAAGKSLRSRVLPLLNMAEERQASGLSPVAKERARLREQARNLRARGFSEAPRTQKQLDFVPDTELQLDAGSELQDAQEPFQTDLEQDAGLLSVDQLLSKKDWTDKDIHMKRKLNLEADSVQKALDELGVDSQVPAAVAPSLIAQPVLRGECSKGKGPALPSDEEEASSEYETQSDSDEPEESSEEGDSRESQVLGTASLLGPVPVRRAPAEVSADTEPPRLEVSTDSEHLPTPEADMVDVAAKEADAGAGANPRAPRQFIPKMDVVKLVSYYEKHFALYKLSIKPKLPSQLVPAKVWKEVYADYKLHNPDTQFKEESLKEPLRVALRDLSKAKGQGELPDEGSDPTQDEELLERLMATDSFRAKGVLQERLDVADRVAGGAKQKKRKAPGAPLSPASPETPVPATSNVSGQTSGGRSVGKVTKSQNLKDSKDGITAMLQVMTNMNDEKKSENQRKVVLTEGKVALTEAKRLESQERSTTLIAQRTAIDSSAKMSRIGLLKEQKALGIIDDAQFLEACKVVFFS